MVSHLGGLPHAQHVGEEIAAPLAVFHEKHSGVKYGRADVVGGNNVRVPLCVVLQVELENAYSKTILIHSFNYLKTVTPLKPWVDRIQPAPPPPPGVVGLAPNRESSPAPSCSVIRSLARAFARKLRIGAALVDYGMTRGVARGQRLAVRDIRNRRVKVGF